MKDSFEISLPQASRVVNRHKSDDMYPIPAFGATKKINKKVFRLALLYRRRLK
jgi:hypothetical protein